MDPCVAAFEIRCEVVEIVENIEEVVAEVDAEKEKEIKDCKDFRKLVGKKVEFLGDKFLKLNKKIKHGEEFEEFEKNFDKVKD